MKNSINSSNPSNLSYVVITPVRNEAQFIGKTIESMVNQTILPKEWIIVDDGSTDETPRIINEAASENYWIKVVRRPNRGFRNTGVGEIESFYEGYNAITCTDWDFIVKLDGDLSFSMYYFENLLKQFQKNEKLGIASGVYKEVFKNGIWHIIDMPSYHAAGACKVLRKNCFIEIGGFVIAEGWDTVDEIKAMSRGWDTGHFPDLQMRHYKQEGTGMGLLRTSAMHGRIYYRTGGDKLFFLLKVIHRATKKPYLLGGLVLFIGYVRELLSRRPLLVTPEEAQHYKDLLRARLQVQIKSALSAVRSYIPSR